MSTPNLNVLLTTVISTYDNLAPNTPLLSNINPGSLPFGAVARFQDDYLQALVGATNVPLPAPTSYVVWVQNKASSGVVGVTVTFLTIGAQQCFLGPGDVYLWFDAAKSSGFTALSLTGIGGTIPCQVYVAG